MDPYIGESFEDRDSRSRGRVVKVLKSVGAGRYAVTTTAHPRNPNAVGRKTYVSAHTLRTRYRKISH